MSAFLVLVETVVETSSLDACSLLPHKAFIDMSMNESDKDIILRMVVDGLDSSYEQLVEDTELDKDLVWIVCEEMEKDGYVELMRTSTRSGSSFLIKATPLGKYHMKAGGFKEVSRVAETQLEDGKPFQKLVNSHLLADLHPQVQRVSGRLFEDGHFSDAVHKAYILLVQTVKEKSKQSTDGTPLMQRVFSRDAPILRVSDDPDERLGYMWLFSGAVMAIRNPKAHRIVEQNDPQRALEWLSFASVLFRVLDDVQQPLDNSDVTQQ